MNLDRDSEDIKNYQGEIDNLTAILQKDPDNVNCLMDRAEFYYLSNQIEKAIRDYERAILLEPNQALIYQSIAVCYAELDNFEKAMDCCREALKLEPELLNDLMAEPSLTHIVITLELESKARSRLPTDRRASLSNTSKYPKLNMPAFNRN